MGNGAAPISEIWQSGRRTVAATATLVYSDTANPIKERIPESLQGQIAALQAQARV